MASGGCRKRAVCYQEEPIITDLRFTLLPLGAPHHQIRVLSYCHGAKVLSVAELCLVPVLVSVQLWDHGLIKHSCVTIFLLFGLTHLTIVHFVPLCVLFKANRSIFVFLNICG